MPRNHGSPGSPAAAPQEPVPVVPIGSGILPWQRAAESGKTASISRRWRRLVLNLAWKSPTSDPIRRHVDSPISQTPPALPSSERAGAYSAHTYLPIIHAPQIPASERNALSRRPMLVSRIPPQPRSEMYGTARLSSLLAYLGWVGHKRARLGYRTVDTSSNLGSKAHDSTLRLMCRHAHCDAMRLKTSILHFPIPHDRVA